MERKLSFKEIADTALKALGLAMGVAVVVMNLLGVAPAETQTLLLGLGLFCLGVTAWK